MIYIVSFFYIIKAILMQMAPLIVKTFMYQERLTCIARKEEEV